VTGGGGPAAGSGPSVLAATGRARALALETALVLAAFSALAIVVTWPLADHFTSRIVGFPGNDQLGYQFDFWYVANNGVPILRDAVQDMVGAPFGRVSPALANLTLLGTLLPAALLTKLFSTIVAYNVLTLAGLVLSGGSMYLLVRWLGLGRGAAAWAGLAYMIFPYHLFAATAFVTLVSYQAFPLLVMGLVAWVTRPSLRAGALVVVMTLLAAVTFPYFGVMAVLMVGTAIAVGLAREWRCRGLPVAAKVQATLAGASATALGIPFGIVYALNRSGTSTQTRDSSELANLGPVLSDYVVPPRTSAFFEGFVGPQWYGIGSVGGERLMYLGWTTVLLAVAGLGLGWLARGRLAPRHRTLLVLAPALLGVLIVASLRSPYPIGGTEVTMPARLIFDAVPFIRAFGRFIVATIAVVIAIGALGLFLLMHRRSPAARASIAATAVLLCGAEFGMGLPLPTAAPSQLGDRLAEEQPTWRWLKAAEPEGILFEYPEGSNTAQSRYYMYGVTVHGHKVLNVVGNPGDESGEFMRQVTSPFAPDTPALLWAAGVRYVTLNPQFYRELGWEMPRSLPEGFALAARFADGSSVWRVRPQPADGFVTFPPSAFTPAVEDTAHGGARNTRWLTLPKGTVRAYVPRPGTYRATFRASGWLAADRHLTVISPDGYRERLIVSTEREVTVTLHVPERGAVIRLAAGPRPDNPAAPIISFTPWVLRAVE
jgi:hypothetical protein